MFISGYKRNISTAENSQQTKNIRKFQGRKSTLNPFLQLPLEILDKIITYHLSFYQTYTLSNVDRQLNEVIKINLSYLIKKKFSFYCLDIKNTLSEVKEAELSLDLEIIREKILQENEFPSLPRNEFLNIKSEIANSLSSTTSFLVLKGLISNKRLSIESLNLCNMAWIMRGLKTNLGFIKDFSGEKDNSINAWLLRAANSCNVAELEILILWYFEKKVMFPEHILRLEQDQLQCDELLLQIFSTLIKNGSVSKVAILFQYMASRLWQDPLLNNETFSSIPRCIAFLGQNDKKNKIIHFIKTNGDRLDSNTLNIFKVTLHIKEFFGYLNSSSTDTNLSFIDAVKKTNQVTLDPSIRDRLIRYLLNILLRRSDKLNQTLFEESWKLARTIVNESIKKQVFDQLHQYSAVKNFP